MFSNDRAATCRANVLVIDDVPENLLGLGSILEQHYTVTVATSGAEGIEVARGLRPDLILLDVLMPGLDGFQTYAALRAIPELGETPVIFLTALADQATENRGLSLGAADFISKPFNSEITLLRIRNLLERERLRREVAQTREMLQFALDSGEMGTWCVDRSTGEAHFDERWCALLGWPAGTLGTQLAGLQRFCHPDDWGRFLRYLDAAGLHDGQLAECDLRLRHRQGEWVWAMLRGKYLVREEAGAGCVAGVMFDISDRKRLEHDGTELLHQVEALIRGAVSGRNRFNDDVRDVKLSRRQLQILELVAGGMTSIQIGEHLNIAKDTVITYRRDLMRKLGVHSAAELARYAVEKGLLRQAMLGDRMR